MARSYEKLCAIQFNDETIAWVAGVQNAIRFASSLANENPAATIEVHGPEERVGISSPPKHERKLYAEFFPRTDLV